MLAVVMRYSSEIFTSSAFLSVRRFRLLRAIRQSSNNGGLFSFVAGKASRCIELFRAFGSRSSRRLMLCEYPSQYWKASTKCKVQVDESSILSGRGWAGVARSTTHLGETTPRLINPASVVVTEGSERRRWQRDNAHSTTGRTHREIERWYKHLAAVGTCEIRTHCVFTKNPDSRRRGDARRKVESAAIVYHRYANDDNLARLNAAPPRFFRSFDSRVDSRRDD